MSVVFVTIIEKACKDILT